jgi:hypothetical protein
VSVLGTVIAVVVVRRLAEEIPVARDRARFRVFAFVSLGFWAGWQLCSMIAVLGANVPSSLISVLHLLAIVLAVAALVSAHSALGDPGAPWTRRHTQVVSAVYLVLGLLFVLIFVVPLTSDQIVDVLRAWGDGPWPKPVTGIAGALFLGAVCAAATSRALMPKDPERAFQPRHERAGLIVVALALVLLAVALAVAHARLGAGVAIVAFALALCTVWAPPFKAAPPGTPQEPLARRLSGTVSVIPLALAFGGLVTASADSLLMPARHDSATAWLVGVTIAVGLLFGVLAGFAQRDRTTAIPLLPWVWGLLAFLLTLLSWISLPGQLERVFVLVLLALAVVAAFRLLGDSGEAELWIGAGVVLGVIPAVYWKPISAPRGFGAFAVAMFGAVALLLVLHALTSLSSRRAPRWQGPWIPQRVPLMTLLALWIALAFSFPADTFHQARTVPGPDNRGTLAMAVGNWLDANTKPGDAYVPMLLVGASGGGSKASYWTDVVLDCVFGTGVPDRANECGADASAPARAKRLFLTSSVSGGSVGIYHFVTSRDRVDSGQTWVDAAAGTEVLSPVIGWGIFHDAPLFMLGAPTDPKNCTSTWSCRLNADRALVQEAAVAGFEHRIAPPASEPELSDPKRLPVTVFNGARDGADARVLLSPFSLASARPHAGCGAPAGEGPVTGALDGDDVLGRTDVPLVTAAVLSARFPVVAPAGRLGRGDEKPREKCNVPGVLPPIRVRDGGYIENTGMLTLSELVPAIETDVAAWKRAHPDRKGLHVQLIALSIDDDPTVLAGEPQIKETRGPSFGIATRAGPAYLSEYARDRLTSCQYPSVTYARISPPPHIGAHAATGWELSRAAREHDLAGALKSGPAHDALVQVRGWLDGVRSDRCDP